MRKYLDLRHNSHIIFFEGYLCGKQLADLFSLESDNESDLGGGDFYFKMNGEEIPHLKFNEDLVKFLQTLSAETPEILIQTHLEMLDEFQQIPKLLDPYLGKMISLLLQHITPFLADLPPDSALENKITTISHDHFFRFLHRIIKTRGWKASLGYFDNSVHFLEPIVTALENEKSCIWETRYTLLFWTSLLAMTPFDLSRIESRTGLFNRILSLSTKYSYYVGTEYYASSLLLMRLMTRKDSYPLLLGFLNNTFALLPNQSLYEVLFF